jgi:DNA-directed RNA polymerase subunit RPC12/RpoP
MGLIKRRQSTGSEEVDVEPVMCPKCGVGSKRLGEYASLDTLTRAIVGGGRNRCEHCGHRMLPETHVDEDDPRLPEDPQYRIVVCPECEAETRVKRRSKDERLDPMTASFLGVGRTRCRSCGHRWTPEDEPA